MKPTETRRRRRGTVLVLTAVMMIVMFAMLAFAVDVGYLTLIRTQLQSSADAAAMAATWELHDGRMLLPSINASRIEANALAKAREFARKNLVGGIEPMLADADVEFGYLDVTAGPDAALDTSDPAKFNAARVRVRRAADLNAEAPVFFMRLFGIETAPAMAEATAVFVDNFSGFKPSPNGKLNMLPMAMDKLTWETLLNGNGADDWTWNEQTQQIAPGPDGVPEASIFPEGNGSPGNRGTVDIGAANNSTADIARQIVEGISAADLEHLGGKIELGPDGTLELNGDTGVSAGMKDELASIRGMPKIISLFDSVAGAGNNAMYNIVGFAGVRVMDVKLTGKMSGKHVIVQPARVQFNGGIPAPSDSQTSYYLYSPVWLVR